MSPAARLGSLVAAMSDSQPESQPQPEPEPEAKRKQNVRLDASVRKIIELELKCGQSAAAIQERLSAGGMNVSRSQLCRLMRRWKETGTTATTGPETRGRKQVIKPEHLAVSPPLPSAAPQLRPARPFCSTSKRAPTPRTPSWPSTSARRSGSRCRPRRSRGACGARSPRGASCASR